MQPTIIIKLANPYIMYASVIYSSTYISIVHLKQNNEQHYIQCISSAIHIHEGMHTYLN